MALARSESAILPRPQILVADDDDMSRDLVAAYLEMLDFDVLTASDGQAALALWQHADPDLLILDVKMPGMDGLSVCREVRQRSHVPILMLTVLNESDDIVAALNLGADNYITKPFELEVLRARVQALLRRTTTA